MQRIPFGPRGEGRASRPHPQHLHDLRAANACESPAGGTADSAARLARLVAESRDVIYETDARGHWSFLNPAWTELTGHDITTSLGERWDCHVHPDDRHEIVELLQGFVRGDAAPHLRLTIRYVHANGSLCVVEALCQPVRDQDGTLIGTSGTLHDITERCAAAEALAASEARFRSLVESAADALLELDLDGICRYVSPAVSTVAGVNPDQLVDLSFLRFTHPDDVVVQAALLASLAEGRCESGACQYRSIDNMGQTRWIEANLHARRDATGQFTGFVGAIRDVTEIVSVVAELELLQDIGRDGDGPTLH